jgi:hypothetical protein
MGSGPTEERASRDCRQADALKALTAGNLEIRDVELLDADTHHSHRDREK